MHDGRVGLRLLGSDLSLDAANSFENDLQIFLHVQHQRRVLLEVGLGFLKPENVCITLIIDVFFVPLTPEGTNNRIPSVKRHLSSFCLSVRRDPTTVGPCKSHFYIMNILYVREVLSISFW